MQKEESGGTFVRYRYFHFHRSRASSFRQFMMFSTICIYLNCTTFNFTTANLFLKKRRLQITRHTKGTVADTALYNSSPFAEQCYHIIQYLHSPEIERYYCCVAPLWLSSLNPFIEFRIWNNSSSSDVLYIQASISISPKYESKSKTKTNDKHARQNFRRKADTYKWDKTRQKLFYPNADKFKNSK